MLSLPSIVLYICAWIIMDDFVNSDDDAQYGAIVPPGHDLGLEYMSTSFPHYQVNVSMPRAYLRCYGHCYELKPTSTDY